MRNLLSIYTIILFTLGCRAEKSTLSLLQLHVSALIDRLRVQILLPFEYLKYLKSNNVGLCKIGATLIQLKHRIYISQIFHLPTSLRWMHQIGHESL